MKNAEGYYDPTAGKAISNMTKSEKSKIARYDLKNRKVQCPTCGHALNKIIRYNIRYCPWCGQKLN